MSTVRIDLPESVLAATGQSRDEFVREARFLLAVKLFEMGRLSSGKAAEACGIGRVDFLFRAAAAGVPIVQLDEDEMEKEFAP
jgi:predicted HTH domain antitoxin